MESKPTPKQKPTPKITDKLLSNYIKSISPVNTGKITVKDEGEPYNMYDKITEHVYIGGEDGAKNKKFFEKHNIKAVLNCTTDIPNHFSANKDIEYLRIPVIDNLTQVQYDKLYKYLPLAVEFIAKHVDLEKNNIYIHCAQGKSRSCAAAAAYFITKRNMDPYKACGLILKKRPEAFFYGTSLNFDQCLVKYYNASANASVSTCVRPKIKPSSSK
ncbi:hypothetical protein CCP3SC1AL1_630008 [Gammaproteobacteria bacterium]